MRTTSSKTMKKPEKGTRSSRLFAFHANIAQTFLIGMVALSGTFHTTEIRAEGVSPGAGSVVAPAMDAQKKEDAKASASKSKSKTAAPDDPATGDEPFFLQQNDLTLAKSIADACDTTVKANRRPIPPSALPVNWPNIAEDKNVILIKAIDREGTMLVYGCDSHALLAYDETFFVECSDRAGGIAQNHVTAYSDFVKEAEDRISCDPADGCNMGDMATAMACSLLPKSMRAVAGRTCEHTQQIPQVLYTIVHSALSTIKWDLEGFVDLAKLGASRIASGFSSIAGWFGFGGEASTSNAATMASTATEEDVTDHNKDPVTAAMKVATEMVNGVVRAIWDFISQNYGCEEWADKDRPFASKCIEPYHGLMCMGCEARVNLIGGFVGYLTGSLGTDFWVSAVAGFGKQAGTGIAHALAKNAPRSAIRGAEEIVAVQAGMRAGAAAEKAGSVGSKAAGYGKSAAKVAGYAAAGYAFLPIIGPWLTYEALTRVIKNVPLLGYVSRKAYFNHVDRVSSWGHQLGTHGYSALGGGERIAGASQSVRRWFSGEEGAEASTASKSDSADGSAAPASGKKGIWASITDGFDDLKRRTELYFAKGDENKIAEITAKYESKKVAKADAASKDAAKKGQPAPAKDPSIPDNRPPEFDAWVKNHSTLNGPAIGNLDATVLGSSLRGLKNQPFIIEKGGQRYIVKVDKLDGANVEIKILDSITDGATLSDSMHWAGKNTTVPLAELVNGKAKLFSVNDPDATFKSYHDLHKAYRTSGVRVEEAKLIGEKLDELAPKESRTKFEATLATELFGRTSKKVGNISSLQTDHIYVVRDQIAKRDYFVEIRSKDADNLTYILLDETGKPSTFERFKGKDDFFLGREIREVSSVGDFTGKKVELLATRTSENVKREELRAAIAASSIDDHAARYKAGATPKNGDLVLYKDTDGKWVEGKLAEDPAFNRADGTYSYKIGTNVITFSEPPLAVKPADPAMGTMFETLVEGGKRNPFHPADLAPNVGEFKTNLVLPTDANPKRALLKVKDGAKDVYRFADVSKKGDKLEVRFIDELGQPERLPLEVAEAGFVTTYAPKAVPDGVTHRLDALGSELGKLSENYKIDAFEMVDPPALVSKGDAKFKKGTSVAERIARDEAVKGLDRRVIARKEAGLRSGDVQITVEGSKQNLMEFIDINGQKHQWNYVEATTKIDEMKAEIARNHEFKSTLAGRSRLEKQAKVLAKYIETHAVMSQIQAGLVEQAAKLASAPDFVLADHIVRGSNPPRIRIEGVDSGAILKKQGILDSAVSWFKRTEGKKVTVEMPLYTEGQAAFEWAHGKQIPTAKFHALLKNEHVRPKIKFGKEHFEFDMELAPMSKEIAADSPAAKEYEAISKFLKELDDAPVVVEVKPDMAANRLNALADGLNSRAAIASAGLDLLVGSGMSKFKGSSQHMDTISRTLNTTGEIPARHLLDTLMESYDADFIPGLKPDAALKDHFAEFDARYNSKGFERSKWLPYPTNGVRGSFATAQGQMWQKEDNEQTLRNGKALVPANVEEAASAFSEKDTQQLLDAAGKAARARGDLDQARAGRRATGTEFPDEKVVENAGNLEPSRSSGSRSGSSDMDPYGGFWGENPGADHGMEPVGGFNGVEIISPSQASGAGNSGRTSPSDPKGIPPTADELFGEELGDSTPLTTSDSKQSVPITTSNSGTSGTGGTSGATSGSTSTGPTNGGSSSTTAPVTPAGSNGEMKPNDKTAVTGPTGIPKQDEKTGPAESGNEHSKKDGPTETEFDAELAELMKGLDLNLDDKLADVPDGIQDERDPSGLDGGQTEIKQDKKLSREERQNSRKSVLESNREKREMKKAIRQERRELRKSLKNGFDYDSKLEKAIDYLNHVGIKAAKSKSDEAIDIEVDESQLNMYTRKVIAAQARGQKIQFDPKQDVLHKGASFQVGNVYFVGRRELAKLRTKLPPVQSTSDPGDSSDEGPESTSPGSTSPGSTSPGSTSPGSTSPGSTSKGAGKTTTDQN